jgi:UDP:flavonoid glycosyltransferase YjiC (YdhE family)
VDKPTIILATSNGIGMGHLARATAVAQELREVAHPIIVSVAGGIAEIPSSLNLPCEYIPGESRGWMPDHIWDRYFRDRLIAIAEETGASVISFDGVVPYVGFLAVKLKKPDLKIVWVRRGLWKRNILRFALPLQSKLVDLIIEPGDLARSYDLGPTASRDDAILTAPVTLFNSHRVHSREIARQLLKLDPVRPAVLVQLGTGDNDMNEKMRAALTGLVGWKDLQVVLTKSPVDSEGNSLVPQGLDVQIQRYFPLADVLSAFDGAIAATGYNSVHELLPACIPTVFISNIRGTDDQDARARWCHDHGFALRADHSQLTDITSKVMDLQNEALRSNLAKKCGELSELTGAKEIARILLSTSSDEIESKPTKEIFRFFSIQLIHKATIIYRILKPHQKDKKVGDGKPVFSSETEADYLRTHIKGDQRFEHMIVGASESYISRRHKIASRAYGK